MTNLKHWTRWFKKKIPGKKLSPKTGKTEAGYTYIMSDLHGCFDELNAMLAKIGFSDQDKLILAGDYIDRGSQNYEMLCWMEQVPQNILLLHIAADNIQPFLLGRRKFVVFVQLVKGTAQL